MEALVEISAVVPPSVGRGRHTVRIAGVDFRLPEFA
jgi:hypothetical protein